jgi:hypothetical protein
MCFCHLCCCFLYCLCTCRLAFVGFTMAAQVTGKGPLAALSEHLADPINTTIFSK